jgi:serine/threonine-protein kinase TTK/MPS1
MSSKFFKPLGAKLAPTVRRSAFDFTPKRDAFDMEETDVDAPPPSVRVGSTTPNQQQQQQQQQMSPLSLFAQIINHTNTLYVNGRGYIRLSQIGCGCGSKVFKVMDDEGNFYALKQVRLESTESEVAENYQNEIALLAELGDSDRIINLVDSQCRDTELLIVLELGDADLREVIKKQQTLSPNYIRYIWQQMLEAVLTIHNRRIIHGDLKPSHFLMVKGILKLVDFGIAKVIRDDATSTEFDLQHLDPSSFRYKAPEHIFNSMSRQTKPIKIGRSADVWSLGCILFELVYGRSPVAGDFIRFRTVLTGPQFKIEFPRLPGFHDFECLVDVMEQCLQRKPSNRPSIEDLLSHQYIQQPSSFFVESGLSIADNLRQFAKQIQQQYIDSDFESPQGQKVIGQLAHDLVCGIQMRVRRTR